MQVFNETSKSIFSSFWDQICEFVHLSVFALFKHPEHLLCSMVCTWCKESLFLPSASTLYLRWEQPGCEQPRSNGLTGALSKCNSSFRVSIGPGHRAPSFVVECYFWMCLWECFWVRLMLELTDRVEQIVLCNLGGPHRIFWGPDSNKKAEWERILSAFLWAETLGFFPAVRLGLTLELTPSALWALQLADWRSGASRPA